ncbi:MAG: glycosyltransferase family 2 protein [Clostridium sp.]|nr:glycosyltransferase family 2 protein [Clostridium sp.]
MKDYGKISIIIPAYNVEDYIEKCVGSVVNQTYKNIEIIIVNDGSKDMTPILIDELAKKDSRIKLIHQKNAGSSSARNRGLTEATGTYIMFLDSDDWLDKNCCEIVVAEIVFKNADVIFFDYYKEFLNRTEVRYAYEQDKLVYKKNDLNEYFIYDIRTITVWGKLYSKRCLNNISFDEKMKISEDVDFNYHVYRNVEIAVYIHKALLHYRILEKSAAHGFDEKIRRKFEYSIQTIQKYMLSDDKDEVCAFYSFVAIAYLVICQNGICLNPRLSVVQKFKEINELNKTDYVRNLFKNVKKVRIPMSRKLLIIMGKYNIIIGIMLVINIKKKVEKRK